MTCPQEPSLRDSIGGRWAISWVTWAVLAIGSVATVWGGVDGSTRGLMLVWAAGAAALGVVFLLAHVTVLRHRAVRPVPVWRVVAVALVAGVARSAAVWATADAVDAHVVRSWPFTLIANVVFIIIVTVGLAPVLDQLTRHRGRRAALESRLAALRENETGRTVLSDALTRAAQDELITALDDARVHLDVPVGVEDSEDRAEVATRLREMVDQDLRPLSHRLYDAGRADQQAPPTRRVSWSAFDMVPVVPWPTALVVLLVLVPASNYPVAGLVASICTWAVLAVVVAAARRWRWVRAHEYLVGAGALVVGWGTIGPVALALTGIPGSIWRIVVCAIVSVILLTIAGVSMAVIRGGEEFNRRLAAQVRTREVDALAANREIARASRDLAQFVHGTLQSRLLAIAFAIEGAAESSDDAAFRQAVHDAREALDAVGSARVPAHDLRTQLDDVAALWTGFIDVEIEVAPDAVVLPGPVAANVARVAEEAVANARKHGRARHAWVHVDRTPAGVRVRVDDDGSGPPPRPVAGMGSAWLGFIAPGAWTLARRDGGVGAVLVVDLPMAPAAPPSPVEARS